MKILLKSFPPIIDKNSKVLILGSMPGVTSLVQNQYYAHPRNQFWKILYAIFNEEMANNYEEKLLFLNRHHLALWDVVESCEREGSLDTAIRNEQINDIYGLMNKYPNIEVVLCNGGKAYQTLRKNKKTKDLKVPIYQMPSTSPAYVLSFEKKLQKWWIIQKYSR